jgi:hypothetical protein
MRLAIHRKGLLSLISYIIYKGKGKVIPLQAWTGPEVSRRFRLPDFMKTGTRRW